MPVKQLTEVPKLVFDADVNNAENDILDTFSWEQKQLLQVYAYEAINAITDIEFDETKPHQSAITRARLLGQLDIIDRIVHHSPYKPENTQE
jgi:hypothetical protein